MSFEARIYIQGVGVYTPHPAKPEMAVLFPDQNRAQRLGLVGADGGSPICPHEAVVQWDSAEIQATASNQQWSLRDKSGAWVQDSADSWQTFDFSGTWLRFRCPNAVPPRLSDGDRVSGLPHLWDVLGHQAGLQGFDELDPKAIPGSGSFDSSLLRAALYLDAGILSPASDYLAKFTFEGREKRRLMSRRDREHTEMMLSSVLKLELGTVDSFALALHDFAGTLITSVELEPKSDFLEIWVRHYCDLGRPQPDRRTRSAEARKSAARGDRMRPEKLDNDFPLNYSLVRGFRALSQAAANGLPAPRLTSSWLAGDPIGGDESRCMGSTGGSRAFSF